MSNRWRITDMEDECMQGLTADAQVLYMRVFRRYLSFSSAVTEVTFGTLKRVLEYIPDPHSPAKPRRVADISNDYIRARIAELERAGLVEKAPKTSRFERPKFRCLQVDVDELRQKSEPQQNPKGRTPKEPQGENRTAAGDCENADNLRAPTEPQGQNPKISGLPEEEVDIETPQTPQRSRFAEFWEAYPKHVGKKPCREKWKAKQLDRFADRIIADIRERQRKDRKWLDGFVPNPLTYLNQERWEDEIEPVQMQPRNTPDIANHRRKARMPKNGNLEGIDYHQGVNPDGTF